MTWIIYIYLLYGLALPVLAPSENKHSLYYQYTVQSNLVEFTAVTVLDGRQIDSYNSSDGLRTHKQDWLTKLPQTDWYRGTDDLNEYGRWINNRLRLVIEDFGHNTSAPPVVYAFAKRAVNNPGKLNLTCMVTGFYPKDVTMSVRKYRTSLPDNMLTSSGIRPNEDETFQLRKSLDILENEKADYDCYVTHSSLSSPVIKECDGKCSDSSKKFDGITVVIVVVIVGVVIVGVVILVLKRTVMGKKIPSQPSPEEKTVLMAENAPVFKGPAATVNNLDEVSITGSDFSSTQNLTNLQILEIYPDSGTDSVSITGSAFGITVNLRMYMDSPPDSGNVTRRTSRDESIRDEWTNDCEENDMSVPELLQHGSQ